MFHGYWFNIINKQEYTTNKYPHCYVGVKNALGNVSAGFGSYTREKGIGVFPGDYSPLNKGAFYGHYGGGLIAAHFGDYSPLNKAAYFGNYSPEGNVVAAFGTSYEED